MTKLEEKDNRKKNSQRQVATFFCFQKENSDTKGNRTPYCPFYHIKHAKTQS